MADFEEKYDPFADGDAHLVRPASTSTRDGAEGTVRRTRVSPELESARERDGRPEPEREEDRGAFSIHAHVTVYRRGRVAPCNTTIHTTPHGPPPPAQHTLPRRICGVFR